MPYRNKTYVAFDGDNDIRYYWLMKAWKQNDGFDFNFHDAHDLNQAYDSSKEESIKRQLAIRFQNSKLFILLVGEHTKYLRKFVPWEIEHALRLDLPIIVVNLNQYRQIDWGRCPASLTSCLSLHVPYSPKVIQYAMNDWPLQHQIFMQRGELSPRYYIDSVLDRISQ